MSVQNIIAHVGFGPFHAFHIYVPFGHIKVILHHWSWCWLLPKEFISNLFPESWKWSDTRCQCYRLQTEQINTEIHAYGQAGREAQCKDKTATTALKPHSCLTYLRDSQGTSYTVPGRSWNQAHEHPSSCHQEGSTICPETQAQPLWWNRRWQAYII